MRRSVRRVVCISILVVVVLLTGMVLMFLRNGPDYRISLPEGYQLVRVHAGEVALCDNQNGGMIEHVDTYGVIGSVVVGYVAPDYPRISKPGYFILDTHNGELLDGLDERQWLRALHKLGIKAEPGLHRPNRFHSFRL